MTGTIKKAKALRADFSHWDGTSTRTGSRVDATGGTVTGRLMGDTVDVLQVYGSGTNQNSTTLLSAKNRIGSSAAQIALTHGQWSISEDVTLPSTMKARIAEGATFSFTNSAILTFAGRVESHDGEWEIAAAGHLYSSATAFVVRGDQTSKLNVGRQVQAVGSATGTITGTISATSHSGGTTTVTVAWDSGSLSDEALTMRVGVAGATNPSVPAAGVAYRRDDYDDAISRTVKAILNNVRVYLEDYLPSGYVTDGSVDYGARIASALADCDKGQTLEFPRVNGAIWQSAQALTMLDYSSVDLNGGTLKFTVSGATKCLIPGKKCDVYGGGVKNAGSSPSGSGEFQCPIIVGNYATGTGVNNVRLYLLSIETNRSNGNGIMITGDSHNIECSLITFPASTTLGRGILVHWGGADDPTAGTTHPYNIAIKGIDGADLTGMPTTDGALIFLSGCYDVTAEAVDADNIGTGVVCYAGDYGDQYAASRQANRSGRGIVLRAWTLTNVAYRAAKVDGTPTVSGSSQEWPVRFSGFTAFGKASSDSGAVLANCDGVTFDGGSRISGFDVHGINNSGGAHRTRAVGVTLDSNGNNGLYVSDSTTPPEDVEANGCRIYGNNSGGQSGDFRAGINLGECVRPKVKACKLGAASGETQFYGVRVSTSCEDPKIDDNHTVGLASSGVAYSIGSSTSYSINAQGQNNTAASGLTLHAGAPLFIYDNAGKRRFKASAAPASGTWVQGDYAENTAPAHDANDMTLVGWMCSAGGTPGTWREQYVSSVSPAT